MRSHRYRKWRPLVGIVALGLFAFGWSLQGAAEERKQPTAQAGARATAVVNTSDHATPVAAARVPGLSAERRIVGGTDGTLTRGVPVTDDVPAFSATKFGERSSGVVGRGRADCICDLDCEDGDECTADLCELPAGTCSSSPAVAGTPCDDGDVSGEEGYCTMGSCDGAGACTADAGGSPCDPGSCEDAPDVECYVDGDCATGVCEDEEVCDDTLDRCEDQECHDTGDCDDGVYCNGEEYCDAENQCVDRKWCTHNDAVCTDDSDCVDQGVCSSSRCPRACGADGCHEDGHCADDPDTECYAEGTGAPCGVDVACMGSCQDDFSVECATDADCATVGDGGPCIFVKGCGSDDDGRCCSGPPLFETCDDELTLVECDAVSGLWECQGGCGYCEGSPITDCHDDSDCEAGDAPCVIVGCPQYSSGWAPPGVWPQDLTPINNQPCEEYYRVGDDYTLANGAYMNLVQFKFVGGVDCVDDGRILFEFWDNSTPPNKVAEQRVTFDCPGQGGVHMWTTTSGEIIIPPVGYVTLMMRVNSVETGHWYSTDVVDIGSNNPDLLWANDVLGAHLSPDDPDILAFELYGPVIAEPIYACCDIETGDCTLKLPWICVAEGGVSLEGVTSCTPDPCTLGACCITATGDCILQPGEQPCIDAVGTWQGYGTDCDPNCCLQEYTGGDNCDDAYVHQIVVPPFMDPPVIITISGDNSSATAGACGLNTADGNEVGWFEAFNLIQQRCEYDRHILCTSDANCPMGYCEGNPTLDCYESADCGEDGPCVDSSGHCNWGPAQCARVTVDACCTDPDPGVSWGYIIRGCSEAQLSCGASISSDAHGWAPYCGGDDTNFWALWEAVPGGTYHYDRLSDPDLPDTMGPYQAHITIEGCYDFACCLPPDPPNASGCPSECIETNRITCELADGFFHGEVAICTIAPPPEGDPICNPGACCPEPGECVDNGVGISCADCMASAADPNYYGGALCEDDPCPVCPWVTAGVADPDYCVWDDTGTYIVYTDRSAASPGDPYTRWADDFIADGNGQVERICWWPCFIGRDAAGNDFECYDDPNGQGVNNDGWQIIFYDNLDPTHTFDIGMPGNVVSGPELVSPDAKIWEGGNSRCWRYSAPLSAGPVLAEGECYWVEITGEGSQTGCQTYSRTCGHDAGNQYSLYDTGGSWGPEDIQFIIGGGTAAAPFTDSIDIPICVDIGITRACDIPPGACIICGEEGPECDPTGTDHHRCRDPWDQTQRPAGIGFFPYDDCDNGICVNSPDPENPIPCTVSLQDCPGETGPCEFHLLPKLPPHDNCDPNAMPIHTGGRDDPCPTLPCTIDFDNKCTNTDGPNPECGTQFGSDIWFEFHAQPGECGNLYINCCSRGTYDGIIAFYGFPCGHTGCPVDSSEMVSCGDDTCGVGAGMPCIGDDSLAHQFCPEVTEPIIICENESYLIRMAGWAEEYGSGRMKIMFVPDPLGCGNPDGPCIDCGAPALRPMAEDCSTVAPGTRCIAGEDPCVDDDDCAEESHCVPPPTDQPELDAVCYAPKTRYLSIARNPDQVDYTTRRVKFDDGTLLGYVGAPYEAAGLWLANVVHAPVYVAQWPDVVHVIGCEIAHASLSDATEQHCKPNTVTGEDCLDHCYIVQASSDDEEYSEELMLCTTSTWGDTCTAGPGGLRIPPDGVPGLPDIMAAISYFQGDTDVAPLTWLDIAPSTGTGVPDQVVGLGDIMGAIGGFQGTPYPGLGPKLCP